MADKVVLRTRFTLHPEGQWAGTCVDIVDLGERVEIFNDSKPRVVGKVVLVFATGERQQNGELSTVSAEFTMSMNERSSLRPFLESWRGRSYTQDEVAEGVPLHLLEGQPALLTIEHKLSKVGRTYAKIMWVAPLPKGMAAPVVDEYRRSPHWDDRKKVYAAELALHQAGSGPAGM